MSLLRTPWLRVQFEASLSLPHAQLAATSQEAGQCRKRQAFKVKYSTDQRVKTRFAVSCGATNSFRLYEISETLRKFGDQHFQTNWLGEEARSHRNDGCKPEVGIGHLRLASNRNVGVRLGKKAAIMRKRQQYRTSDYKRTFIDFKRDRKLRAGNRSTVLKSRRMQGASQRGRQCCATPELFKIGRAHV